MSLFVGEKKRITLGDVETMVLAAKQRSLYELTDAISAKDRVKALQVLDAILSTGDGEEAAIGHLYMLAKTFRQMLVIFERKVRDSRMLWQALWQGFRVPPFAAEDIIRQARRYQSRRELTRALRLIARADLALRSNPTSKRMVLENLVLELASSESGRKSRRRICSRSCWCNAFGKGSPRTVVCYNQNRAHHSPAHLRKNPVTSIGFPSAPPAKAGMFPSQ